MKSAEVYRARGIAARAEGNLVRCYGEIGISAVAGALACQQGAASKPGDTSRPADQAKDERPHEDAVEIVDAAA